ncbi:hypothetical protein K439DRAFT_1637164, partial [Ramaria rubella]
MPSSSPSDAYPSWLPKCLPPPVPASMFSTTRAATNLFPKVTDPHQLCLHHGSREPTGNSAHMQPPLQPALHPVPTHAPHSSTIWPCFCA